MLILSKKYLFISLVLLEIFISQTNAAAEFKEEWLKKYDCKKIMGGIVKKILKSFANCTKIIKASTSKEDFDKKSSCVIKCAVDKLDLLTPEGKVTKETLQKFISGMVPEELHEFGFSLVEHCMKDSNLDPKDPYCVSYGGYAQCVQNSLADFADKAKCQISAFG